MTERTPIQETGYRLGCVADQLRGQAALSRETASAYVLSCALDDLARQIDDLASPLLNARDDLRLAA